MEHQFDICSESAYVYIHPLEIAFKMCLTEVLMNSENVVLNAHGTPHTLM